MKKVGIGIIGCGKISGIYLKNLSSKFTNTKLVGVHDLDKEKMESASKEYGVKAMSLDELLSCDDIKIVVNLTTPAVHFEVCKSILEAGKHAYVEKPLSLTMQEGSCLAELAEKNNLLLGCAPDTFLGAGIQTAIKVIRDGIIGDVIGATAFMMCHGHERWHPAPEFYYKKGGGPMFDMGPYYLTALVSMIGPVSQVCGMTSMSFPERMITSQPKYGELIKVEVPTHVCGIMRFKNGAIGNIITSFDVWGSNLPRIEVYGTRGSMIVPDPNTFGGDVLVKQQFAEGFEKIPLLFPNAENSRGIGVSDMAQCVSEGRKNLKADGKKALHVLEIMHSVHESNDSGKVIELSTSCEIPETMEL